MSTENVPSKFKKVKSEYHYNRKISRSQQKKNCISVGIPQGSVLGPTLWNVLCDNVLRLGLPRGGKIIGFADDLALIVTENDHIELTSKVNASLVRIMQCVEDHRLKIAPERVKRFI